MKINAYIMASELPWLASSISSYYSLLDRLIVTCDDRNRSWTGRKLDLDVVIQTLKSIDVDKKMEFIFGHFSRNEYFDNPMVNDTYQRQVSLDLASENADWVLQFDTDEILLNSSLFRTHLEEALRLNASELWYPALWVYNTTRKFLIVHSDRFFRPKPGYPGPVAVRPNTRLVCARQSTRREDAYVVAWDGGRFPFLSNHPRIVSRREKDCIVHMSWVRNENFFDEKALNSSHAHDFDWMRQKKRWKRSARHPFLHILLTPFISDGATYARHTLVRRIT